MRIKFQQVFFSIFILLVGLNLNAQDLVKDSLAVDDKYREDQFYFGITYNLIGNNDLDISQTGFSSGFHFGFIRDMPINKSRTFALGLGLGYSANALNQNLFIGETPNGYIYDLLTSDSFEKNRISLHVLEAPFEFRWRQSTPEEYRFWRIYTGVKFGYVFANSVKFKGASGTTKLSSVDDFSKFHYGLTLSVGYNIVNAHIYYGLNSIFEKEAQLNGQSLEVELIKIGLIIYVL